MSTRQRIVAGLAAHGFGQAVTIGTQLLLVPLFFRLWGAERYGEWLLLSAIPAYLVLADLGIGSAAANEMAMRAGAGDRAGAQQTFRGAQAVAWVAAFGVLVLGAAAAAVCAGWGWPSLTHLSAREAAAVLWLLSLQVALGFSGGVVQAGFRCAGFNGLGTTWANVSRLLEGLASAAVLIAGAGALALCLATLAVRVLLLGWQWVLLRRSCPWLFEPRQAADPGLVRRLLWPSLAFMAFPVGLALALQGPILIIGGLFGPAAVATFSAMRTLARLPVQFTNVLNAAVAPEVSRAHGQAQPGAVQRLHRRAWWATAGFGLLACASLALLGPWLGTWWLGEGRHDQGLLMGLLLVSWVSAVWNVSSIVLTATNRHVRLSAVFLVVNALGLALAWGMGAAWGLPALVAALVCAELLMLLWVTPAAQRAAASR